jgi:SAM-dependent methyltransferase
MMQDSWLVHRIHDAALQSALKRYASGVLIDIGCGEKPYRALTQGLVSAHVGIDHPESLHARKQVDILATAYETGLADETVDTILSTVVLEHLERPQDAIDEMHRILKPGGAVILSAPLFWHIHEAPRDFYRYTKYGLSFLLTCAGFEIIEIKPLAGFMVTFSQELVYVLSSFRRGLLKYPVMVFQAAIQLLAYALNRWDRSHDFTWAYLVIAHKRPETARKNPCAE